MELAGPAACGGGEGAGDWTAAVGMTFHEVRINANAHTLELVFADLDVGEVTAGYVPFAVDDPD